ncbi:MAG: hypothetical protein H6Q75_322 [Firmicutes bacterium]|nr:hypothetical protein [Bacillota bacterium]
MIIAENINSIQDQIRAALSRRELSLTGTGNTVKLVAVTKNHPAELACEAISCGMQAIGENRVQEALSKAEKIGHTVEWHLIGHLQTNKVRQAVEQFDLIHSVDSQRLAEEINRIAGKMGKRQDILIQVNVADEDTKFGIRPDELFELTQTASLLEHVRLCGLMTIAPYYEDAEEARPIFKELYRWFSKLKAANIPNTHMEWLSMGMTNDYAVAIEEGANLIRVGTGIFGSRNY